MKQKRVLLAMSGGVDSSVAAYILKKEGYEVIGATIKTWAMNECRDERAKGCCSIRDVEDARSVARKLDIPFYVLDMAADFEEKIIDPFINDYVNARTPNPCIQCNNHIKFGIFLEKARSLDTDFIATGHYARKAWDSEQKRWYIREGIDLSKDQSYVLFGLNQEQLSQTLLPIGGYTKKEIREIAKELDLRVFDKPDSQEICFVSKHYSDVIKERDIELPSKGELVNLKGEVIGQHDGYFLYTIGQRKRIQVTDKTPYYVIELKPEVNQVVVGKKEDLQKIKMRITKMNWMKIPEQKKYQVKIRSRHTKSSASLVEYTKSHAWVEFYEPESAITPGQAAVFYDGDAVIGGGWIEKAV